MTTASDLHYLKSMELEYLRDDVNPTNQIEPCYLVGRDSLILPTIKIPTPSNMHQ